MRVECGEIGCFSEGGGVGRSGASVRGCVGRSGASVRVGVWGGVVLQ